MKPLSDKKVVGDASETGLVKFCESILSIEEARAKWPVFSYMAEGKAVECVIPFNSEIKFNLNIRDMNPS